MWTERKMVAKFNPQIRQLSPERKLALPRIQLRRWHQRGTGKRAPKGEPRGGGTSWREGHENLGHLWLY